MKISIRPYTESDFEDVTSIWRSSWQSTGIPAPITLDDLRERWPQELAKGWIVHVAVAADRVVGFVAVHGDKLEQLFVVPDRQCCGIGKQLLDFAKKQMPTGFHLTTALESRAPRFYEREGLLRGDQSTHEKLGHQIVRYEWPPCLAHGIE
jgi:GNAT superfamily N-acetyltransferase